MKLKAFCCFYNEAALIPFFLSHYHFLDTIEAFVSPSQDATRELLADDPRVIIHDREMPLGIDDEIKQDWINEAITRPDHEHAWHFVVDADEFLWPPNDPSAVTVRDYLDVAPAAAVALLGRMAHIYRGAEDADLDLNSRPVVLQRRRGTEFSLKPIVLRANSGRTYWPGNHRFKTPGQTWYPEHEFFGAHWQNADPSFSIARRVRDRGNRISPTNRLRGHGSHHWGATVEGVEQDLRNHLYDAPLF